MVDQEQQNSGAERRDVQRREDDFVVGKPTGDRIAPAEAGEDRVLIISESSLLDRLNNPSQYEAVKYSDVRVRPDEAFRDPTPENHDAPTQDDKAVRPISDEAWQQLVDASDFLRQRPKRPEPSKLQQGEDVGSDWKTPSVSKDPNTRGGKAPE